MSVTIVQQEPLEDEWIRRIEFAVQRSIPLHASLNHSPNLARKRYGVASFESHMRTATVVLPPPVPPKAGYQKISTFRPNARPPPVLPTDTNIQLISPTPISKPTLDAAASSQDELAGDVDLSTRIDEILFQMNEHILRGQNEIDSYRNSCYPHCKTRCSARRTSSNTSSSAGSIKSGPSSSSSSLLSTRSSSSKGTQSANPNGPSYFKKGWAYSNARLPADLPLPKIRIVTWPLISLATRYSLEVYTQPAPDQKTDRIKPSGAPGSRAILCKTATVDDKRIIVLAFKGTSTCMDWMVNCNLQPVQPDGFLDDQANLCHSGFLQAARLSVAPICARLRTILENEEDSSPPDLLITGHSAGGAVAQLLYAHMFSKEAQSDLKDMRKFLGQIHCITFGAPPLSLVAIRSQPSTESQQNIFYAFVNEGDPIVRADVAIVKSLLKLYLSPIPKLQTSTESVPIQSKKLWSNRKLPKLKRSLTDPVSLDEYKWKMPVSTFKLAGNLILVRDPSSGHGLDDIEARQATDEMMQDVVFADPNYHSMTLYSNRLDVLAKKAITLRE